MKTRFNTLTLARATLVVAAALSAPSTFAVGQATTYTAGDLFIGFREFGEGAAASTLAVNIGQAAKFLPISLGGTWNGNPLQVQFGVIPTGNAGAGTPVFSLAPDLAAVFGLAWANNPEDGTGVRWAVAGITDNISPNVPISGFGARTVFQTKAETTPGEQSTLIGSVNNNTFAGSFLAFTSGISATSYTGRISTDNSSTAYIGGASETDNWSTRAGTQAGNLFGGRPGEQALNGPFSGPTNSVLDLYLIPGSGSTATTARTYLGSFALNADGELTYANASAFAVPEPGSAALLGLGAGLLGLHRRRSRSTAAAPAALH